MLNYMVNQGKVFDYVVGEWFGADRGAQQNWINEVISNLSPAAQAEVQPKVFDFSLRESLRASCDDSGYDVRNVYKQSLHDFGVSSYNIATFVNNHDFREPSGYNSLVQRDPILAYAYILTNNQIGVPNVFYPDYYGYPDSGIYPWHPTDQTAANKEIDELWLVHKKYIHNAENFFYLNSYDSSNTFDDNANYISGSSDKSLIYQIGNTSIGKAIIVAINFSDSELKVDHSINSYGGAIAEGSTFTDVLQHSNFPSATVDLQDRIYIDLPPRSYSVWVQGEVCPIINEIPVSPGEYQATFKCTEGDWEHFYTNENGRLEYLLSTETANSAITILPQEVTAGLNPGNSAIDLSAADYVSNNTWWTSRRYWQINNSSIADAIKIRMYFNQNDVDELTQSSNWFEYPESDLAFYSVNAPLDPNPANAHADVSVENYDEVVLSGYSYSKFGNYAYGEFTAAYSNGGGMGAGGSQGTGALPAYLFNFSIEQFESNSNIIWATENNEVVDSFELFYSTNGVDFNKLADVPAKTQLNSTISYNYVHQDAAQMGDTVFYRLKLIYKNLNFGYSPIRLVEFDTPKHKINLFPNPLQSGDHIQIQANNIRTIEVIDVNGKMLKKLRYPGLQSVVMNTSGFTAGLYFIRINQETIKPITIQ